MADHSAKIRRIAVSVTVLLVFLGADYWQFALRPAMQAKKALRLVAAAQVGRTSAGEFRRMADEFGADLDERSGTFILSQRNLGLEYLHLAPPTIVAINANVTGGVVTLIYVRAWIGKSMEIADIQIHEADTPNGGCVGGPPVCVKPYSSTRLTSTYFIASTPLDQRKHLLSLNTWCLAKIGGCKDSREFYPAAWENEPPPRY